MTQIADAVQFLHESNIIHQAIIPEAIMIMSSKVAKLGALCFSRPANDKSFNYESTRIPERLHRYIAPEVLRNDLPTRGVDAFSLCAVLFELMTGFAPWASTKVRNLKPQCSQYQFRMQKIALVSKFLPRLRQPISIRLSESASHSSYGNVKLALSTSFTFLETSR